MKIYIMEDEAFPVYRVLDETWERQPSGDISDEEFAFIKRAEEDWEKAQDILSEAYHKSDKLKEKTRL